MLVRSLRKQVRLLLMLARFYVRRRGTFFPFAARAARPDRIDFAAGLFATFLSLTVLMNALFVAGTGQPLLSDGTPDWDPPPRTINGRLHQPRLIDQIALDYVIGPSGGLEADIGVTQIELLQGPLSLFDDTEPVGEGGGGACIHIADQRLLRVSSAAPQPLAEQSGASSSFFAKPNIEEMRAACEAAEGPFYIRVATPNRIEIEYSEGFDADRARFPPFNWASREGRLTIIERSCLHFGLYATCMQGATLSDFSSSVLFICLIFSYVLTIGLTSKAYYALLRAPPGRNPLIGHIAGTSLVFILWMVAVFPLLVLLDDFEMANIVVTCVSAILFLGHIANINRLVHQGRGWPVWKHAFSISGLLIAFFVFGAVVFWPSTLVVLIFLESLTYLL